MNIADTALPGVKLVTPEPAADERGFFARTFCGKTFARHGMAGTFSQCSVSFNHRRGTLRGLHYQAAPHEEAKLVRCTRGAMFDVAVDLRPGPTYGQWVGAELSAANRHALYLPPGVAHGFQTLSDDCEVFYQISPDFVPEAARGIRYDDPAIGIDWPLPISVISERDSALPAL